MSKKILIVEDQAVAAMSLDEMLFDEGFDVTGVASSASIAMMEIDMNKPDLVLMDVLIKGHFNGIDLAKLIGEKYNIPVIFITANQDMLDVSVVRNRIKPFAIITKPYPFETLAAEVHRFFESRAQ